MNITLRLTSSLHHRLLAMAMAPVEAGAILLAHLVPIDGDTALLLGSELIPVPEDAYEVRSNQALQITSDGYIHALKTARTEQAIAIWVHSHPGNKSSPRPSRHDLQVNADLDALFRERTESDHYGYLIVGHSDGALTFSGAVTGLANGTIRRLNVAGERWIFSAAYESDVPNDHSLFDRHIRAFGSGIQETIGSMTVAVVGAGGTGSAVAEQLTRLGVRSLILIDPDTLSSSNTTRVYGSRPVDVGRLKVDVLGDHLEGIADGMKIERIAGTITEQNTARALLRADVVFGCTDDNAGRLRLSRLPYYYLTPVIDCGIRIDADQQELISGIYGRVTTLHSGAPCLNCRQRIDLQLAEAEIRAADEQAKLQKEGYAPALPGVEPAVVTFTTLVAATAVSELLERLVGFGESPAPTELILRIHDRTVRHNAETGLAGHYCDPTKRLVGTDREMFLGLNWAS